MNAALAISELSLASGVQIALARRLQQSLGDRACCALACHLNTTALTTGRAWRELDLGFSVECIPT